MKMLSKVLIVDDSPTMRKVLVRELTKLGFAESNIQEAEDGKEAIRAVRDRQYHLIIIDWNMPNILGIDAVRSIRGAGIKTPILMVTTESERANVISAVQAGANNYLVKPFTSESFRDKVMALLEEPQKTPPVEAPAPVELPPPQLESTRVDLEAGRIIKDQ